MVNHVEDYPTMMTEPWEMELRGGLSQEDQKKHHIQIRSGFVGESTKHFFTNDLENPYIEEKRFDWIRGNHVGGRSITWGKQVYRWSDLDFEANAKEGIAVDWPIRYKDIEQWYTYVEKFVGVSGEKLGLPHLPDGYFLPPMELNSLEKHFRKEVAAKFKGRPVTIGRVAHLTEPKPWQFRIGAWSMSKPQSLFSVVALMVRILAAMRRLCQRRIRPNNFAIRPNSVVHSIILDEKTNRATGVRVIDSETKQIDRVLCKSYFLLRFLPFLLLKFY